jgi:hypothetical protein
MRSKRRVGPVATTFRCRNRLLPTCSDVSPFPNGRYECPKPEVRRSWRTLDSGHQQRERYGLTDRCEAVGETRQCDLTEVGKWIFRSDINIIWPARYSPWSDVLYADFA